MPDSSDPLEGCVVVSDEFSCHFCDISSIERFDDDVDAGVGDRVLELVVDVHDDRNDGPGSIDNVGGRRYLDSGVDAVQRDIEGSGGLVFGLIINLYRYRLWSIIFDAGGIPCYVDIVSVAGIVGDIAIGDSNSPFVDISFIQCGLDEDAKADEAIVGGADVFEPWVAGIDLDIVDGLGLP